MVGGIDRFATDMSTDVLGLRTNLAPTSVHIGTDVQISVDDMRRTSTDMGTDMVKLLNDM